MQLYHGSGDVVEFPDIRISKFPKDFSWGFYCTVKKEQAQRWAKKWIGTDKTPTLNYYRYIENKDLKILKFEDVTDEWLNFIANCRSGKTHEFDMVEGPMADDMVWNFVKDYLRGYISKGIFEEYAKFNRATHQISFHTLRALECLEFERSEVVK